MAVRTERRIEDLPRAEVDIGLVIDCTGVFKTAAKVAPDYAAGVKMLMDSAPVMDLAKMSSNSAVKRRAPEGDGGLFRWVAVLTSSKDAVKGFGVCLATAAARAGTSFLAARRLA